MILPSDELGIMEQCEISGIHRSGFYYVPAGESDENLKIMRLIDAYFPEHPHSGVITMCVYLCMDKQYCINIKRVRRLMRLMGLMAIYPGKKLSLAGKGHKIYPYLLRGLQIERKNQVWATDITYVPMKKGFMFMMAVIDVKIRFIGAQQFLRKP
jgi:putative transposase